jgi:hypothetical protein
MKIEGHRTRSHSLLSLLVEYSLLTTIATVQLLPSNRNGTKSWKLQLKFIDIPPYSWPDIVHSINKILVVPRVKYLTNRVHFLI